MIVSKIQRTSKYYFKLLRKRSKRCVSCCKMLWRNILMKVVLPKQQRVPQIIRKLVDMERMQLMYLVKWRTPPMYQGHKEVSLKHPPPLHLGHRRRRNCWMSTLKRLVKKAPQRRKMAKSAPFVCMMMRMRFYQPPSLRS